MVPHPLMLAGSRIAHLVLLNAFVGAMVGMERTVLPLLAEADFGITSTAATLSFIASFGVTKATVNFFAGAFAERYGRRPLLLLGWLVGLPVPLLLIWAPSWGWVLFANVLLGMNQSLAWSMTVVMKVDLVPEDRFGLVIGWNEFAGYAGMALAAAATGFIATAFGLGPEPFYLGLAIAVAGLLLSLPVRETRTPAARARDPGLSMRVVARRGTWSDAMLSSASLSGLATNLKDGVLWGLLPILLVSRGLGVDRIGIIVGLYPLVWAGSQLFFGPLSDEVGRRQLIGIGLMIQASGVALFAIDLPWAGLLAASVLVGTGTGMVYPTLLAFVAERADAGWRASALGVYRLWRDLGYAAGAIGGGVIADALGLQAALLGTAGLVTVVALVFAYRTRHTSTV